jgi:hypothetical protein
MLSLPKGKVSRDITTEKVFLQNSCFTSQTPPKKTTQDSSPSSLQTQIQMLLDTVMNYSSTSLPSDSKVGTGL